MSLKDLLMLLSLVVLFSGCPTADKGSIEGSVDPPGPGITISVAAAGVALTGPADTRTGRFHFLIAPGTYDVRVQAPASPYPLVLTAIVVRPGETTSLGAIQLSPPPAGTASIRGQVKAASSETIVALVSEGIERANVHADAKGAFLFERLQPGTYELQVRTPGYANDSIAINLLDDQQLKQDIRQLYITAIEGIDWQTGVLRARGIGLPPTEAPTPAVRREMAKRAALADAERNLLRALELLQVGPERKLSALYSEKIFAQRLQGFLRGYRITADRDLSGGRVEIEIEKSLTGTQGLTAELHDR